MRVYSRHTGELVEELVHHTDTVTDVVLDRNDKAQVPSFCIYQASLMCVCQCVCVCVCVCVCAIRFSAVTLIVSKDL